MLKNRGFYKGINLGGWLSQCSYSEEHLNTFITEQDIAVIASWGVDHVRIPVDYNIFEAEDGAYLEEGFSRLDRAFEWCRKHGLNAVLDLHKTAGFSFDSGEKEDGFFESEKYQERFYRLWEQFAERYGSFSDRIAFELLNEVTEKHYIDAWNRIARRCIERIREYAPDTLILVGSYYNNCASAVKDLDAPYDSNVIYNFHCYEPLGFTHQGATWTDKIDPDARVSFEESGVAPEFFDSFFASAIDTAKRNHTDLYCGEYGVIDRVSPEDTFAWFKAINSVFEAHRISRSAWSYKAMDFGLSDPRLDSVRSELIKYL